MIQEFTSFKCAIHFSDSSVSTGGQRNDSSRWSWCHIRSVFNNSAATKNSILTEELRSPTWPQFVDMLIRNQDVPRSVLYEEETTHTKSDRDKGISQSKKVQHTSQATNTRITKHWAPYWLTCSPCHPTTSPKYILHANEEQKDIEELLRRLDLKNSTSFNANGLRLVSLSSVTRHVTNCLSLQRRETGVERVGEILL